MDQAILEERDLESGGTTSEEDTACRDSQPNKLLFGRVWSGSVEDCRHSCNQISSFPAVVVDTECCACAANNKIKKSGGSETPGVLEPEKAKDKRKSTSSKKPPKPPRPPRGLSLDAADQKLIKEISDLAMLKRARVERMKALKKMKAAKASTSNSNLYAALITVLFCLVIVFQGQSFIVCNMVIEARVAHTKRPPCLPKKFLMRKILRTRLLDAPCKILVNSPRFKFAQISATENTAMMFFYPLQTSRTKFGVKINKAGENEVLRSLHTQP